MSRKNVSDDLADWLAGAQATAPQQDALSSLRRFLPTRTTTLKAAEASWILSNMSTMVTAGLPAVRSLRMMARMRDDRVGQHCTSLADAVSEGQGLSQAMTASGGWDAQTLALVSAGEASGDLSEQLTRATALIAARVRLRKRLIAASIYPAFVVVLTAALITGVLLLVVPQFKGLYAQFNGELPVLTQLVVSASSALPTILAVLLCAAGLGRIAWRRTRSQAQAAMLRDRVLSALPLAGKLYRLAIQARVAATFSGMLSAGVGVLEACTHAAAASGSPRYAGALRQVRQDIAEGSGFAQALGASGLFPELMVQLAKVGEESASLPVLMERYAKAAEEELDSTTQAITSLVEPLLMLVVGVVVGFFVVALYLPLINLSSVVSGG